MASQITWCVFFFCMILLQTSNQGHFGQKPLNAPRKRTTAKSKGMPSVPIDDFRNAAIKGDLGAITRCIEGTHLPF